MWEGSDDTILGQFMQLQVIEGLPRANDSDVCKKTAQMWSCSGPCRALKPMVSTLAYTYLCLSPPFQGYHLQICKEENCDDYKSLDLIYLVFYKTLKKKSIQSIPLDSLLWRLALELTSLPLLELGGSLAWGGGASADAGGWLDLSFGWLKIHFELLCMRTCVQAVSVRHLSEV